MVREMIVLSDERREHGRREVVAQLHTLARNFAGSGGRRGRRRRGAQLAHERSSLLPLAPRRERMALAARAVIAFVAARSRAKKRSVGMLSGARLVAVVGAEGAGFRRGLPWPCRIH